MDDLPEIVPIHHRRLAVNGLAGEEAVSDSIDTLIGHGFLSHATSSPL
jgi:hypothetical protein